MQFVHSPLTWAFFLVLVPLVIHLINMMRHKRVQWAAMDFLLRSYKKHRRWVWLKQLLLLLLRMLAIAVVVAMLAKLVTNDKFSALFGNQTTHHFVLLDDSLSMSDRAAGSEAFDRARRAIAQIAARAANEGTSQKITLLRYSRARQGTGSGSTFSEESDTDAAAKQFEAQSVTVADLSAERATPSLEAQLEEKERSFNVTQLAVGPAEAIELAGQLIAESDDNKAILHLVSDFRSTDWQQPGDLRDALGKIEKTGVEIRFLRCVKSDSANLAITELTPAEGTQAAGVPLFVDVKVTNYSATAAEQIPIKIRSTFHATSADGKESAAETSDLPDLLIDRIEPGATVSRQFQVFFPTAGQHSLQASLPMDAVEADNHRWCVIDLAIGDPVLIVDGDADQRSQYYLESMFRPGTKTRTGILPESQPPSFLRDVAPEELERFQAIYLMNVAQLDQRALQNLQQYVEQGGGLAIFMGPNCNASFYTNWYADGTGLFPAPLTRVRNLEPNANPNLPDVEFDNNPIFDILFGKRNPFARSIRINRFMATPDLWKPPSDSSIEVMATLRNRKPLILQRRFGDGRVVAVLTTLAPDWNNWALEPSFIVVALQLQSYLSEQHLTHHQRLVGAPLQIQLDATRYRPEIAFSLPATNNGPSLEVDLTAKPFGVTEDSPLLSATLGLDPQTGSMNNQTSDSGVYEARLRTLDGVPNRRRYPININTIESDLSMPSTVELAESLKPVNVTVSDADQLLFENSVEAGQSWGEFFLWTLIAILIVEQFVAYSASYHSPSSVRAGGLG
ncbi:MAG: BatA domain-containing protein [Pirellulaceae bacterium]|nr:BatA domain-containing protein [Pirellulaceae bacterium]